MRAPAPVGLILALAACGEAASEHESDAPDAARLEPEPAGAPAEPADGLLGCLGDNEPPAPEASTLALPGWVRRRADPTAAGGALVARVDALDPEGAPLASPSFSDPETGMVEVTVPVGGRGFHGTVLLTAEGFVDYRFRSSHRYAARTAEGWAWMLTPDELAEAAAAAGVTLDPGEGVVAGAVHDCVLFGVGGAVVRVAGRTDGVVYLDALDPGPGRTFTGPDGRFAAAAAPGPAVVEAFGRLVPGGPLVLLSRADVEVLAGAIAAVDLQPRAGVER